MIKANVHRLLGPHINTYENLHTKQLVSSCESFINISAKFSLKLYFLSTYYRSNFSLSIIT
jgi:hypothetical protein